MGVPWNGTNSIEVGVGVGADAGVDNCKIGMDEQDAVFAMADSWEEPT